jgi:hypothetical protein
MGVVAALGLAGTILQFLKADGKFVRPAWRLQKSGHDALEHHSELAMITNKQRVHGWAGAAGPGVGVTPEPDPTNPTDPGLARLAADCRRVASDLLALLKAAPALIPEGSGSPQNARVQSIMLRKRDAAKAALKIIIKEDEIKQLQERLASLRNQLSLHLFLSLREFAARSAEQQAEILNRLGGGACSSNSGVGVPSPVVQLVTASADT